MKFGVVVFPGSNCDQDVVDALELMDQKVVKLWHKSKALEGCDMIIIPGGFSYGDYLRAGAISRFSPIMDSVLDFAHKGGYVFGICNGFQILTEAGLLPGVLLPNLNQLFICEQQYLKPVAKSLITQELASDKVYNIPIAHADGRYYAPDDTVKELHEQEQVLFYYCDQYGRINEESNPNGSINNIAGICNKKRNVMGMMPHPERAADELLGNTDGCTVFESIIKETVKE